MNRQLHRLLTRALLALVLVFAQQAGLVHAATHLAGKDTSHEHRKGLKAEACDECLSFAQVQGTGAAAAGSTGVAPCLDPAPAHPPAISPPAFPFAFHPRAPPSRS